MMNAEVNEILSRGLITQQRTNAHVHHTRTDAYAALRASEASFREHAIKITYKIALKWTEATVAAENHGFNHKFMR